MMSLAETASAFTHEVALLDAKTQAVGSTDTGEAWELLRKYRDAFLATNPRVIDRRMVDSWVNSSTGTLLGISWEWDAEVQVPPYAPGAFRVSVAGGEPNLMSRTDLVGLILGRRG